MQHVLDQMSNSQVMKLVAELEKIFKQAPHLPRGFVDFLVKIAPYAAALGGVFSIVSGLNMLTGSGLDSYLQFAGIDRTYFQIIGIQSILVGILYIWSFKYLKERSLTGWLMMFWGELLYTVFSIVSLFFYSGGVVGTVIGILIGLYFLFEVKSSYKKSAT